MKILNPNSSIQKTCHCSSDSLDSDSDIKSRKISTRSNKKNLSQDHIDKFKNIRLMHKKEFRSFFGLLGSGSNPFLSDRIFHLADQDNDQHVTFEEFATIIDIYQNGTTEEKNEFSFALFDEDFDGIITFEDMYLVMKKFMGYWSTL